MEFLLTHKPLNTFRVTMVRVKLGDAEWNMKAQLIIAPIKIENHYAEGSEASERKKLLSEMSLSKIPDSWLVLFCLFSFNF